ERRTAAARRSACVPRTARSRFTAPAGPRRRRGRLLDSEEVERRRVLRDVLGCHGIDRRHPDLQLEDRWSGDDAVHRRRQNDRARVRLRIEGHCCDQRLLAASRFPNYINQYSLTEEIVKLLLAG